MIARVSRGLPIYLTVSQVADLLQTTRKAIYNRIARGQMPGVVKDGQRRILIRRDDLLASLKEVRVPSPEEG